MLVARERFDNFNLPQQRYIGSARPKKIRRVSPRTKFFYCAVVLLSMCLAFLLTSKYAQIASMGYDIVSLKKQVSALDVENQVLQNKLAELKSLQNIEYIATTRLGMQKPELAEGVQFVPVEYSKAGSKERISGLAAGVIQEQPEQSAEKKNFLVQALAMIING